MTNVFYSQETINSASYYLTKSIYHYFNDKLEGTSSFS